MLINKPVRLFVPPAPKASENRHALNVHCAPVPAYPRAMSSSQIMQQATRAAVPPPPVSFATLSTIRALWTGREGAKGDGGPHPVLLKMHEGAG